MILIIPVVAFFLAAVLFVSAIHKHVERSRLASATAGLLRLNPAVAVPVTLAASTIEFAAALSLIFPVSRSVGAFLAAFLWLSYGAMLLAARRRGDGMIDCGCEFGKQRGGIGHFSIGRAFALAAAALFILLSPAVGGGFDVQSILAALAFLALLYAAGEIAHLPAPSRSAAR